MEILYRTTLSIVPSLPTSLPKLKTGRPDISVGLAHTVKETLRVRLL